MLFVTSSDSDAIGIVSRSLVLINVLAKGYSLINEGRKAPLLLKEGWHNEVYDGVVTYLLSRPPSNKIPTHNS
jgi:hypothetical protein